MTSTFDMWQMLLWLELTWQHQKQRCGEGRRVLQIPILLFHWNTKELCSVLAGTAPDGPGRSAGASASRRSLWGAGGCLRPDTHSQIYPFP